MVYKTQDPGPAEPTMSHRAQVLQSLGPAVETGSEFLHFCFYTWEPADTCVSRAADWVSTQPRANSAWS